MADINVQDSNLYQINDTNESVQQTLNSDDRLSNEVNQTEHRNGNSVTPSASVIFLFYPLVLILILLSSSKFLVNYSQIETAMPEKI